MITEKIKQQLEKTLEKLDIVFDKDKFLVEQTDSLDKGDYTTNIAMKLASELKLNPLEIGQKIVDNLKYPSEIEKVEIAGPGFINFYLSDKYLLTQIEQILSKGGDEYVQSTQKEGKNILIEYTDANPFKVFHIGHLYTNTVGESFSRLQQTTGANVKRANYQGEIGLHVAKAMWGIKYLLNQNNTSFEDIEKLELSKRVEFLGEAYMTGAQHYDEIEDKAAIEEINDLNYYLYQLVYPSIPKKEFKEFNDIGVKEWYRKGRLWCLDQFSTLYETLGTDFDYMFFESEAGEIGYKIVKENIGKIFKEDDGAVIYEGDPQKGLHTRVFINQHGLPTYEGKEMGLAKEKNEITNWDESIMITGHEQAPYFKVVFDAMSKIMPEYAAIALHIPHGLISLPGMKKMSSRKGEVVSAEDLLNSTQESVKEAMKSSEREFDDKEIDKISRAVAISAIKYAFLKVGVGKNILFDISKDIKLEGDTGPYLMYVYTRAKSIIESTDATPGISSCADDCLSNPQVKRLVREISKVEDVVLTCATNYSPSTLCNYLFELGQIFNKFYQEVNVLNSPKEDRELLLAVVGATCEIMATGLHLLGIQTVNRM